MSVRVRLTLLVCLCLGANPAWPGEISSNGLGGGLWSDPATWNGNIVPGPDDDVVVRKLDVVVFDRNDDGKASCQKLLIDPRGTLLFKTGVGKLVLCPADVVESFGPIKLDGTKSAGDMLELRLVATKAEKRQVKLGKGAALLLYGKAGLPDGTTNVAITAPPPAEANDFSRGVVEAEGQGALDFLRARVEDVKVIAKKIDNTGAKPGEKIQVSDCRFTGQSRLSVQGCDTPVITRNRFEYSGTTVLPEAALHVYACPLADIRGNSIAGAYQVGISLYASTDVSLVGNTIEKCSSGITGAGGLPNLMMKQCVIKGGESGLRLEGASSAVVEDVSITGAQTGYSHTNSNILLTDVRINDVPEKGTVVEYDSGVLSMLNCNVVPKQVKFGKTAQAKPPEQAVVALQYLVVGVKDAPADAQIEVRTATPALPADAADPNVRNSPAPLVAGRTPLPRTLNPLIIRAWSQDAKGTLLPVPEYAIKVLGPPAATGTRPVLRTLMYRPQESTFRPMPNDAMPTVEVPLK
jgi:hypothetical protein